jgi:hypothetical protein
MVLITTFGWILWRIAFGVYNWVKRYDSEG